MRERVRVFRFDPKSPKSWLVATGALIVGVARAAVFFTLFLAVVAVGMVALPILVWRQRRALARQEREGRVERRGDRVVIDAEYTIESEGDNR